MTKFNYAQKDADVTGGGINYKGITHDQVLSIVRPHLVENGIVIEPKLIADKWSEPRKGKEKSTNWLYEAFYKIAFVNIDKPEDRVIVEVTAHANDSGDKAPGKALSYAVKMAMLKVFGIETGENEESRTFDKGEFSEETKDQFDDLVATENALAFYCFAETVGPDIYAGLYNSFPDGKKKAGKDKCNELYEQGKENVDGYIKTIAQFADNKDPAAFETYNELTQMERPFVWRGLVKHQREYLHLIKKQEAAL